MTRDEWSKDPVWGRHSGRRERRAEGEKGRDKRRRQHNIMDIAAAAHAYMYVHGTYTKVKMVVHTLCLYGACKSLLV